MSLWTPPPEDSPRRLADLRVSYDAGTLLEPDLLTTPLAQFTAWFDEAVAVGLPEPNAMIVATADAQARPSGRTVLLKQADHRGFAFYTNYGSRKSADLTANPQASCVFPWFAMHRQVVVIGSVERIGRDEAEEYYSSRPHGSRLGAWASRQSTVIDGRDGIEAEYERLQREYPEGADVPIPEFWGGWLVRPTSVEFWQGRESRLHDRLRYVGDGSPRLDDSSGWSIERLSP